MSHSHHRAKELHKVTLLGAVINLFLAAGKIIIGLVSNSSSLLADGIHSLSDLISDSIIMYVSKYSSEGPDLDHPYGHNRFETMATLGLGILLLIISIGIIFDAISGLIEPSNKDIVMLPIVLLVATTSVLSKEFLFWKTIAVANKHNSDMIRVNAYHHRSDAASSLIVIIGVIGVFLGYQYIDFIAAIVIGVLMIKLSYDFIAEPVKELVDTSICSKQISLLSSELQKVEGVVGIHSLRARKMAESIHCDLHVQVRPFLSVSEGHMIAKMVSAKARDIMPAISESTIHIDPEDDSRVLSYAHTPSKSTIHADVHSILVSMQLAHTLSHTTIHYINESCSIDIFLFSNKFSSLSEIKSKSKDIVSDVLNLEYIGTVKVYFS